DSCLGFPGLTCGPDDDFDIATQSVEESGEPIEGEAVELTPQEGRNLGLIDAEDARGLGLSQLPFGDDVTDSLDQLRLGEQFLRVLEGQVGEDVATTLFNRVPTFLPRLLRLVSPHDLPPPL